MDSCVWSTVHHSKDEEKLQCIVQILQVQKVETIFNTVQALAQ